MTTFEYDADYEEAAQRSYELSVMKGYEYRDAMKAAMGEGEVTFTGAAREDMFFSHWQLVEDVLRELQGKAMVHLTINGSHERHARRYTWQSPDVWEVTVTHMGGCYSRYFYT